MTLAQRPAVAHDMLAGKHESPGRPLPTTAIRPCA